MRAGNPGPGLPRFGDYAAGGSDRKGCCVAEALDAALLRRWCHVGLDALGVAREEIDALNVFPVPDGDTGTNLFLTMEAVVDAVESGAGVARHGEDLGATAKAMARGALLGARGNSGVILSQWLHGAAEVLAERPVAGADSVRRALATAATQAYAAVAEPIEGTVLSVARAAANGAAQISADDLDAVVLAAAEEAAAGLARTTAQLPSLQRAGVVDAGGRGLVVLLDCLVSVVAGTTVQRVASAVVRPLALLEELTSGPAFEVMYLLEAADAAIGDLRATLSGLGDSLLVVGGDGLWNVHVHVDDAGAAVEAGVCAGRPHRIQITHFGDQRRHHQAVAPGPGRMVVSVAPGPGFTALFDASGAVSVSGGPGARPSTADVLAAIRSAGTVEVVVLPNDPDTRAVAESAAHQAREGGLRVAVLPTSAPVQALAALAVHDRERRFDDDVVTMTAAAGATRHGELTVAVREAMTMAGVCQVGDVLGLLDGDIAVIGHDLIEVGNDLVDRMLAGGGELVTLVMGQAAPSGLADRIAGHIQRSRPEVEVVVYEGGQPAYPLLVGVE